MFVPGLKLQHSHGVVQLCHLYKRQEASRHTPSIPLKAGMCHDYSLGTKMAQPKLILVHLPTVKPPPPTTGPGAGSRTV